jgi:nucleotide-binding universal stress UspA family protein
MIDRVLVPMDDSEMATRALEYALEAHPDAEITVLYVAGEPSAMMGQALRLVLEEDLGQAVEELAESVFERARELAAEHDGEIDTVVDVGSPARVIVTRAADFDVVVIGSHSGDLQSRLFVGNVAERVFRRSPVPVTVVR